MNFLELHHHIYSGSRAKLTMGLLCYLLDNADQNGACELVKDDVLETLDLDLSKNSSSNLSHSLRELREGGIVNVVYHRGGIICEKPGRGVELRAVLTSETLRLFGKK